MTKRKPGVFLFTFPLGCAIILYGSGLSTRAIAPLIGKDRITVGQRLRRAGVVMRPRGGPNRRKRRATL